jgi:membrane-associated PAP2 superfamily phosphatase
LAGQTGGAIRLSLIFLVLFASRQKEQKKLHVCWPPGRRSIGPGLIFLLFLFFVSRQRKERHLKIYFFNDVCSFFCLCKRKNERKANRNDIQPLPVP